LLFRRFHYSLFPYHRYLYLTGVLGFFFDTASYVMGQALGLDIRDLLGMHHDPDLTPGLNGKNPLDAVKRRCNFLERIQPFNVSLDSLPAGTRSGTRN
jgi:hypothetical protein